ncbi:hypothetical protein FF1_007412 [Malus domestica]
MINVSGKGRMKPTKISGNGLTSEPLPPPPSPPSFAWDLLNLFDAYERKIYVAPLYSCTNLDPEEAANCICC